MLTIAYFGNGEYHYCPMSIGELVVIQALNSQLEHKCKTTNPKYPQIQINHENISCKFKFTQEQA